MSAPSPQKPKRPAALLGVYVLIAFAVAMGIIFAGTRDSGSDASSPVEQAR